MVQRVRTSMAEILGTVPQVGAACGNGRRPDLGAGTS